MSLYKSTKSDTRPKHDHLIFLKETDEGTVVVVGESNGHSHEGLITENGIVKLLPAGKVAHTHEIEDAIEFDIESTDDENLEESEKKAKFKRMVEEATELEKKSIEKGEESEDFYAGKQWSDADKAKLAAEDRQQSQSMKYQVKLTFCVDFRDKIEPTFVFFEIESGDNDVSHVGTDAVKNVFDINNFQVTESKVFKDEVTAGRGIYHHYVDYDKNMMGKIVVEKLPWNSTHFGRHDNDDLSDCEYIIKQESIPKKKLKLMFPEKKDEIDNLYRRAEEIEFSRSNTTIEGLEYRKDEGNFTEIVDIEKQMINVKEVWEKNYLVAYSVVDFDSGFVDTVNNITQKQIKSLEGMGLEVIKRTMHNMKVTICAGEIILDEKIEEQDFFAVVPVYAKRTAKGEFYGKVEDVKDIQREINKRHSQSLDIVNRVASYGYFYDDTTFESVREETQWKQDLSKAGWTGKVRDLAKLPVQTQGTRMPSELVGMQQLASEKMMTVMNVSPEVLGFSEREVSSVAIIEKRRNVLTANEFLYDNLAQAKRLLSKNILKMIQKVYTPERLMRLIANQNPQSEEDMMKIQKQSMAVNTFLNETEIENLDVAVDVSAHSPTTRSANFSMLMEMMRNGAPIPPEVVISSSDLPNKDEIMAIITGQKQQQQQAEQQKNQVEIQKTIIANSEGGMPPQQGMPQQQPPLQ